MAITVHSAGPRKVSTGERFARAVGPGLQAGMSKYEELQKQEQANQQRTATGSYLESLGFKGASQWPADFQKKALEEFGAADRERIKGAYASEKQKTANQLSPEELKQEEDNYNQVSSVFGEKFANLWKASPVGGRTELLRHGIDALSRGHDINELLSGVNPTAKNETDLIGEVPQLQNGKVPKDFKWPDFVKRPEGYTAKEWNEEKKNWRKENSDIFTENKKKLKNNDTDARDVKKLGILNKSGKLPKGLGRILIDPETGEIRPLAQLAELATPETQEYVKIFSRFQNRAKDTFGSRVTNFDLQSYMKQFPGLLNTEEGRERILEMMDINLQMDQLYDNALDQVYKKYGLNGVPQEKADELAKAMIRDETEKLEKRYLGIEEKIPELSQQGNLTGKMVDVIGPDGQAYEIDEGEIELLPPGFRL